MQAQQGLAADELSRQAQTMMKAKEELLVREYDNRLQERTRATSIEVEERIDNVRKQKEQETKAMEA